MVDNKELGKICQKFRRRQGISQLNVAIETGYSVENISAFECGRNNNVLIFLWYVYHGMTAKNIFDAERFIRCGGDINDL